MNKLSLSGEAEVLGIIKRKALCSGALPITDPYSVEELSDLFPQCAPATSDFMLGVWRSECFDRTKKPFDAGWYGKRITANNVDPVLFRKADGCYYAWDIWGHARLREMQFSGQIQACLLYDDQPWIEAFRRLNDDTALGLLWHGCARTSHFFWMERIPLVRLKPSLAPPIQCLFFVLKRG